MIQVNSTPAEHRVTDALLQHGIPFSFDGMDAFVPVTSPDASELLYTDGDGLMLRCVTERYRDSAAAEWTL